MLIEHISGSYRRQTRNRKMWWCVTTVNRMLQLAKSPWSANPACVTTTLKTATWSTQSQPRKVNAAPTTATAATPTTTVATVATTAATTITTTTTTSKIQRSWSTFDLGSCAKMYGLPKSKSPPKISAFGPCVDQSQRWSNLRGTHSCNRFFFILLSHV